MVVGLYFSAEIQGTRRPVYPGEKAVMVLARLFCDVSLDSLHLASVHPVSDTALFGGHSRPYALRFEGVLHYFQIPAVPGVCDRFCIIANGCFKDLCHPPFRRRDLFNRYRLVHINTSG